MSVLQHMAGISLHYNMVSNCGILVNSFSKQHFYIQQKIELIKAFYIDKTIIHIIKMWIQALNWFKYENFPTMKHVFSSPLSGNRNRNKHHSGNYRFLKVVEKLKVISNADISNII